ncbi:MAG: YoaK family protein [Luteibacter sp.]
MPDAAAAPKRDPIALLLTLLFVVTGLVDATSVLGLGKVFTANMTGNVVFLGFALAGAPGFHWLHFVVALLAFGAGAVVSARLFRARAAHGRRRWLVTAAWIEAGLLWVAAACALPVVDASTASVTYLLIVLTAAAMGSRNATVQHLKVPDLTTTVLTRTITALAVDSRLAGGAGTNFGRRWHAIVAMFVGAVIGGLLVLRIGVALPLALAGLGTLVATLILAVDEEGAA